MDDAKSSEKKSKEPTNQICTLAYPILDGSGKQFNIQYSKSIPSATTFPTLLTKIPISRNFTSYQEYSYITKKWYTTTKALFSQYIFTSILPSATSANASISLFNGRMTIFRNIT